MKDGQIVSLALARGELRRLLVDAGTTLVVISGRLRVHGPIRWLAESVVAPEARLGAEQTLDFRDGGWIDLVAGEDVAVLVVRPGAEGLWQTLGRIGRRCAAALSTAGAN